MRLSWGLIYILETNGNIYTWLVRVACGHSSAGTHKNRYCLLAFFFPFFPFSSLIFLSFLFSLSFPCSIFFDAERPDPPGSHLPSFKFNVRLARINVARVSVGHILVQRRKAAVISICFFFLEDKRNQCNLQKHHEKHFELSRRSSKALFV